MQGGKNHRRSNCRLYSPPSDRKPHLRPRHLLAPCLRPSLSTRCRSVPVKDLSYGSSPFSSHLFSSPAAQETGGAFCEAGKLWSCAWERAKDVHMTGNARGEVDTPCEDPTLMPITPESLIPYFFPLKKSLCRFWATSPARGSLSSSSQPLHLTHSPVCTARRSSSLLLLRSLELVLGHVSLSIYIDLQEYRKKLAYSFK